MGHSYNNGLHTSSKGITIDAVRVTGLTVAPGAAALCTIAEDCKSGLISSVTHTATGTYVFQMTAPYPPKMVIIDPTISASAATQDLVFPRYLDANYDPALGKFTIVLINDDDAAAGVAVEPTAANELMVLMMFNRYTR